MTSIIVVCCDSLRGDVINSTLTPNIWKIANEGVYYTNALSCGSITPLSMPYLLCGQPLFEVEKSIQVKAEKLGYKSKLITTNWQPVYSDFRYGFRFALYEPKIMPHSSGNELKRRVGWWLDRYAPINLRRMLQRIYSLVFKVEIGYLPADKLLPIAESHLEDNTFMWIHLMDPHIPYRPQNKGYSQKYLAVINQKLLNAVWLKGTVTPDENNQIKRLYKENVYEMDLAIGKFYDKIKNKAIFVLTSDHGDEHGEEGWYGHHGPRVNRALRHVPLIIVGNGRKMRQREEMTLDILPHILLKLMKG